MIIALRSRNPVEPSMNSNHDYVYVNIFHHVFADGPEFIERR